MKRALAAVTPFLFVACSSSTVQFRLNSNDSAPSPAVSSSALSALSAPSATGAMGADPDLTTVKSVKVTIDEVDAHFAADDGKSTEDADQVPDQDKGWVVVTSTPQTFDLMSIRNASTLPLGSVQTNQGKITQVRLKLKTDTSTPSGDDLIKGAVIDSGNNVCDLAVPHSASNPGLKIVGMFQTSKLPSGDVMAEINIRLKNSSLESGTATCTYHLSPVIELERVEAEDHLDGGDEPRADGGSETRADGGS